MPGAVVFGVVLGSAGDPAVGYLSEVVTIDEVLDDLQGLDPTTALRISAPCEQQGCAHFDDRGCSLGRRLVEGLDAVVEMLPKCAIRSSCRWFHEQGSAACRRCPQVITRDAVRPGNTALATAATPPTPVGVPR